MNTPIPNISREILNQRIELANLVHAGSNGKNAELILRTLRKFWGLLIKGGVDRLDDSIKQELLSEGGNDLGQNIAKDLRRIHALNRYFRTRKFRWIPYVTYREGEFVLVTREDNMKRLTETYFILSAISELVLEALQGGETEEKCDALESST